MGIEVGEDGKDVNIDTVNKPDSNPHQATVQVPDQSQKQTQQPMATSTPVASKTETETQQKSQQQTQSQSFIEIQSQPSDINLASIPLPGAPKQSSKIGLHRYYNQGFNVWLGDIDPGFFQFIPASVIVEETNSEISSEQAKQNLNQNHSFKQQLFQKAGQCMQEVVEKKGGSLNLYPTLQQHKYAQRLIDLSTVTNNNINNNVENQAQVNQQQNLINSVFPLNTYIYRDKFIPRDINLQANTDGYGDMFMGVQLAPGLDYQNSESDSDFQKSILEKRQSKVDKFSYIRYTDNYNYRNLIEFKICEYEEFGDQPQNQGAISPAKQNMQPHQQVQNQVQQNEDQKVQQQQIQQQPQLQQSSQMQQTQNQNSNQIKQDQNYNSQQQQQPNTINLSQQQQLQSQSQAAAQPQQQQVQQQVQQQLQGPPPLGPPQQQQPVQQNSMNSVGPGPNQIQPGQAPNMQPITPTQDYVTTKSNFIVLMICGFVIIMICFIGIFNTLTVNVQESLNSNSMSGQRAGSGLGPGPGDDGDLNTIARDNNYQSSIGDHVFNSTLTDHDHHRDTHADSSSYYNTRLDSRSQIRSQIESSYNNGQGRETSRRSNSNYNNQVQRSDYDASRQSSSSNFQNYGSSSLASASASKFDNNVNASNANFSESSEGESRRSRDKGSRVIDKGIDELTSSDSEGSDNE